MDMDKDVLGMGSLNFDYIYEVDSIATGDQQVIIKNTHAVHGPHGTQGVHGSPGGSAANCIYGLAKLGVGTAFFGAVGDDSEGEQILFQMKDVSIDTSLVKVYQNTATSKVMIFVDKDGERAMYTLPGASTRIRPNDHDIHQLNQYKLIIISAIPGDAQFKLLKEIVSKINKNVKIVFMPGALYIKFGFKRLHDLLKRTYLLILNHRELQDLTNKNLEDGINWLIEKGCRIIVVTLGSDGCLVADSTIFNKIPTKKIPVNKIIDSTGAGDAFTAGILFGLLNNKSLKVASLYGNLTAANCIQALGARAGLLDKKSLLYEFKKFSKEIIK